jgi:hypothetical protein
VFLLFRLFFHKIRKLKLNNELRERCEKMLLAAGADAAADTGGAEIGSAGVRVPLTTVDLLAMTGEGEDGYYRSIASIRL